MISSTFRLRSSLAFLLSRRYRFEYTGNLPAPRDVPVHVDVHLNVGQLQHCCFPLPFASALGIHLEAGALESACVTSIIQAGLGTPNFRTPNSSKTYPFGSFGLLPNRSYDSGKRNGHNIVPSSALLVETGDATGRLQLGFVPPVDIGGQQESR